MKVLCGSIPITTLTTASTTQAHDIWGLHLFEVSIMCAMAVRGWNDERLKMVRSYVIMMLGQLEMIIMQDKLYVEHFAWVIEKIMKSLHQNMANWLPHRTPSQYTCTKTATKMSVGDKSITAAKPVTLSLSTHLPSLPYYCVYRKQEHALLPI